MSGQALEYWINIGADFVDERPGHRLQAIEAEAVTAAMRPLWRGGVPVVQVHDSLIVPASAAEWAAGNLVAAYVGRCGASIYVTRHGVELPVGLPIGRRPDCVY